MTKAFDREKQLEELSANGAQAFDVVIIGGGINGAVSAACLRAAGYTVMLVDKGDFAGMTSSQSSNLAWGGIKYLETHEYGLVADLCKSRNELMRAFPSTVKEVRFVTTLSKGFRKAPWFVYLGTLVYWVMGRFFTQRPHYLQKHQIKSRAPQVDVSNAAGGIEYSDCYLYDNDARFVFNFIKSAQSYGAICLNYVEASSAQHDASDEGGYHWQIALRDVRENQPFTVKAKVLINAAGPLADQFNKKIDQQTDHRHVFSKGIHLIVERISQDDEQHRKVLTFFADDGRMFFIIPMGNRTCLGTTDTRVDDPNAEVTDSDRQFVLDNVNQMLDLDRPLTTQDIIAERCGVRPLAVETQSRGAEDTHDWLNISRKHAIDSDSRKQLITIFGGKLTDCVNVGEEIRERVISWLPPERKGRADRQWYGEPDAEIRQRFMRECSAMNVDVLTPFEAVESISSRLWRRYGNDAFLLLDRIAANPRELTPVLQCANYLICEIHYAREYESVVTLEDFVRRRGKLSLVTRHKTLIQDPGLAHLIAILFADSKRSQSEIIEEYNASRTV